MWANVYFWYILAIDGNAASLNIIEPEDESNDGAFSRARWSHLHSWVESNKFRLKEIKFKCMIQEDTENF